MRWGVVVCVLACVACNEAAVKFVVDPTGDPNITEVRLYLGIGSGDRAPLSPKGFEPSEPERKGAIFVQDIDGIVDKATVTGAPISFVYTGLASDGPLTAIAVGFDAMGVPIAQDTVFGVDIPGDHVVVWQMTLERAVLAAPNATGRQIQVWGAQDGMQTCVHAVTPDSEHDIAYIVGSASDKDCDGFAESDPLECDDYFYRSHPVASRLDLNCLATVPVVSTGGIAIDVCTFGTRSCVDGVASMDSCKVNPRYCLPDDTCPRCIDDIQCAYASWQTFTSGYHCPIEVIRNVEGKLEPCPQNMEVSTIHQNLSCPTPTLVRYHDSDGGNWASTTSAFGMTLTFAGIGTCQTKITPSLPANGELDSNLEQFGGLMDIPASTGNHILTPISFEFVEVPACRNPSEPVICQANNLFPSTMQPVCVDPSIQPAL